MAMLNNQMVNEVIKYPASELFEEYQGIHKELTLQPTFMLEWL